MSTELLTEGLRNLSVSEPECLVFDPPETELRAKLDDVPRYLFRVFTPKSDGLTDKIWAKSKDATNGNAKSDIDMFSRNRSSMAAMLNRHLRWSGKDDESDNLVSWTSSLLVALQYIFYRHSHYKDGSKLNKIYLCILDTTSFPSGVFLRDMDLISAYHAFSSLQQGQKTLLDLERLRNQKHSTLAGSYYFGEYLSQGALKIENKCSIVSAQKMIDRNLPCLRPEFEKSLVSDRTLWANEVISLREAFSKKTPEPERITNEELFAALNIARLFGRQWRLPMAASLIGLLPRQWDDIAILQTFAAFTDAEKENCSLSKTKVIAYDTLPEVRQFEAIIRSVYEDFCYEKLGRRLQDISTQLRDAIALVTSECLETIVLPFDPGVVMNLSHQRMAELRLGGIIRMSRSLQEKIRSVD